jgi:DUF971 family protein
MQLTEHNAVDLTQSAPVPVAIRYEREQRCVMLDYANSTTQTIAATTLRAHSPSSVMKGPDGQQRTINVPDDIAIIAIEPIGNYAVRLTFSDGHASGIYSWQLLWTLGAQA